MAGAALGRRVLPSIDHMETGWPRLDSWLLNTGNLRSSSITLRDLTIHNHLLLRTIIVAHHGHTRTPANLKLIDHHFCIYF